VLIAAFASILGRSTLVGIAAGLGTLFLEGIASGLMRLAGGWVGDVPNYLLDRNADSLMAANGLLEELRGSFRDADTTMLNFQPQWEAALILGGYSLLALIAALVLFRRRDVTA
jgi:ABC-2 type transport system permease protein